MSQETTVGELRVREDNELDGKQAEKWKQERKLMKRQTDELNINKMMTQIIMLTVADSYLVT